MPIPMQTVSEWYTTIVERAGLAEHSPVRGCMTIKPYGWALWENIQRPLDEAFKATGHQNAYFPIFIPLSFLAREAQHVEGFAQECAVVTHYRIKTDTATRSVSPDPEASLEEPLVVRPTSETIIWHSFKDWIHSYRDLPLLINQWANVVRWEKRPRLFLRTAEFLWQEGHTAHATAEEALQEARMILDLYASFVQEYLAIPVIKGVKTPNERFAGAVETFTIETLLIDGKALQAGTSHFLGQNFARAFDVKFLNAQNELEYVWATSWGVSTRLIGAVILSHGDEKGLILPPRIAPIQVVVIPIWRKEEEQAAVTQKAREVTEQLKAKGIRVKLDDDPQHRPGWKFNEWELRGVPLRFAVGPRDLEAGTVEVAWRHSAHKSTYPQSEAIARIEEWLMDIQKGLFDRAKARMESQIYRTDNYTEMREILEEKGGFIFAHWDGTTETELAIKEETGATIRCIPLEMPSEEGRCIYTGRPSSQRVLFAKAY
ncbi:MAG: proline--tRNA ligase [Bacteroidia bacterium]|nr:proline--tRNA ligase [Bacteroidia bacterium]MCX7652543.1 proline--tRNA ligase [Bacteroidia bacterium]MDW8417526.1 proline--tRNA ligase [Bacteroidia bacterium]